MEFVVGVRGVIMNKCPCFECGSPTITRYYKYQVTRICESCGWEGYKVKIPTS